VPRPEGPGVDAGVVAAVHAAVATAGGPPERERIRSLVRRAAPLASAASVAGAVERVVALLEGLGPLDALLADPSVSEVMVNGPGRPVWVERAGRLEVTGLVLDPVAVDHAVERIVAPLGLRADRTSPTVDARLPDGSRAHVVVPPLAVDGPCITIRRFAARHVALGDLCPPGVAELLAWAVRGRCYIVSTGGTGAGKTTLLNALAREIPAEERIVTVEDAAELRLAHPHVVRLECRPGSAAAPAADVRLLVRNALRMRPDRVVVGEVRGAEAFDLLAAMNTGHEGALATVHANGPADALARLETLALLADVGLPLAAVRAQLEASLDLVVHVARRSGGARSVVAVAEVLDAAARRTAGTRARVRQLAGPAGVEAVPWRPARAAGAPAADPGWVQR
jgi:pilus assembly protein CpaF